MKSVLRRFLEEDRREFGKGGEGSATLVTAKFGAGRSLEIHPARMFKIGRVAEVTQQAEPFDVGALDIAGSEVGDGGSGGELAQFSREEDGDEFGGAFPVLRGKTEMKISLEIDRAVGLAAGGGEAVAPDGVYQRGGGGQGIELKAVTGPQIREMEDDLVGGVVRVLERGGDGESLPALEKAEDDTAGGGPAAVVDEGKFPPNVGRAPGDGLKRVARVGVGVMSFCQDLDRSFGWSEKGASFVVPINRERRVAEMT